MAIWFVVSYLILWFIGGACTNPIKGTSCLAPNALDALRNIPLIGLLFPYDAWSSIMYFLAPICGFIFAFITIKWWNYYFDTKEASGILFLVFILIALFVGYYINLSFYVGEAANLNSRTTYVNNQAVRLNYSLYFCVWESNSSDCQNIVSKLNNETVTQFQSKGGSSVNQLIPVQYWPELRRSMYLSFILGAIAAWGALFGKDLYEKFVKKE